ncbi:MAG: exodeoxyribonuclease VII large subunit [Actinomycetota bacterium]|nr:exodeoxyribonuclease VII large subunit [Actinomycetota bacterium]
MKDYRILKTKVYTVSELNQEIRKNLESGYPDVWIEGEVSNFYFHEKKHMYFDLKDESSKIKVVMFRHSNKDLLFEIEEGLHILINGYVSAYEKRGEYQVIALRARPVGRGALILAFEQLKARLEKKGYFKHEHKKKIPVLPGRIGLVTSTGGSVIRDIILVLKERFDNFHLIARNVNVQGATSSDEVCDAIDDLCEYGVDVIILARGGGSLEDLWAFNTEKVADKIYKCPIPLISAIGHETDYTISDFVADKRAATPSVAGEVVILNKKEMINSLRIINRRIRSLVQSRINIYSKEAAFLIKRRIFLKSETLLGRFIQNTGELKIRLLGSKEKLIGARKNKVVDLCKIVDRRNIIKRIYINRIALKTLDMKLFFVIKNYISRNKNKLKNLLGKIGERNPSAVIKRGFALLYGIPGNESIKGIKDAKINQKIKVLLKDGILKVKVFDKINKKLELGLKDEN